MPEDSQLPGLLAHLVPKLTPRLEDTATEALAFILNKSEACRSALTSLLNDEDFGLGPLTRFDTQVTHEDGSRPDMVGYDRENKKRLIVEAKFWADLGEGQASGYFSQLEVSGPATLMFIAPGTRVETLWTEIRRQMDAGENSVQLGPVETLDRDRMRRARIGTDRLLMLVSWDLLLERLAAAVPAESPGVSDIQQLRGFVEKQDMDAFQPLQREELSPSLARRILSLEQLINGVVDRGDQEGWISQRMKYEWMCFGRYFRLRDDHDDLMWLGVPFWMWARKADTPLWLWIDPSSPIIAHQLRNLLRNLENPTDVFEEKDDGLYVPIHLPIGIEYHRVRDSAEKQVTRVAKIVLS